MSKEQPKELAAQLAFYNPSISIKTDLQGDKIAILRVRLDPACVGKAALLALMQEVSFEADVFVKHL